MSALALPDSQELWNALQRSLLPLSPEPSGPGWNHAAIAELPGAGAPRAAAVLIGVREATAPRLILTLRTANLLAHAGQVAFPGGSADPCDADAVATALREAQEEIGLDPGSVTPLGYLDRFETTSGYCITPVVARVDATAALLASPGEVAEVFEVPLGYLMDPANLRRYRMAYRGQDRDMVEFVHAGHRIWGVTAAIVDHLLQRMRCA